MCLAEFLFRGNVDHADGGRIIARIENQQIFAVSRKHGTHGERAHFNLLAGGPNGPTAVEQKPPSGSGPTFCGTACCEVASRTDESAGGER